MLKRNSISNPKQEKTLTVGEKQVQSRIKEIFEWIKILSFAGIAAFFINYVVIVNAAVPSPSMNDTIPNPSRVVAFRLAYMFSEPERFDVIVFNSPENNQLNVKRIIGMPNETVHLVNGQVFINDCDTPLEENYIIAPCTTTESFTVPEGYFFVMGDNRNNSHDSRDWINTFLPRQNIRAKAIFTWFPNIGMIE